MGRLPLTTDLVPAVRLEALRARSSRPLVWLLLGGVVGHVVVTLAVVAFLGVEELTPQAYPGVDVAALVLGGPPVLTLVAAFAGVLVAGVDARHGVGDLTFLLTPRRGRALAAKLMVVAVLAAGIGAVGVLIGAAGVYGVYVPLRGAVDPVLLVPVAVGQVGTTMLWGLAGACLAVIARSVAVAGVVVVTLAWLVEPVLRSVTLVAPPGWWSDVPYLLPFAAMNGITGNGSGAEGAAFVDAPVSPGVSLLVALAWTALGVLGAYRGMWRERSAPRPAVPAAPSPLPAPIG